MTRLLLNHKKMRDLGISARDIQRYRNLFLGETEAKRELEEIYSKALQASKILHDTLKQGFELLKEARSIKLMD